MDDFTKIYDQPVEIAVGKPVNTGKDGYYEFFLILIILITTDQQ